MSAVLTKSQVKRNDKLMERSGSFTNPFEHAPYYWMITSSLKSVKELQVVPPTLFPKKIIWGNYFDSNFNPTMFQQDVMQGLFQRYPDL